MSVVGFFEFIYLFFKKIKILSPVKLTSCHVAVLQNCSLFTKIAQFVTVQKLLTFFVLVIGRFHKCIIFKSKF